MTKDLNTYRAVFQHPKLDEGKMQIRIPTPLEIEIFQATKDRWEAWHYSHGGHTAPLKDQNRRPVTGGSLASCKDHTRQCFEKCVRTWEAYDPAGKLIEAPPAAEATA